jgi:hypothetical protein
MTFKVGDPKPENSGKIKGNPNKKNQEIQDLAKELGCNPVKILMLFAMGKHEDLGYEKLIEKMTTKGPIIELAIPPDLMKSAATELMANEAPLLYSR